MSELLPVHGFVLAGGKSSRMGTDKALLEFRGRPLVEIAVEKLRGFCAEVSIAGNREDLTGFAPVVRETCVDCGPAAGIEAGLRAARQEWVLFVPVDVPLVPGELLRRWAEAVLEKAQAGCGASFLTVNFREQPAFCLISKSHLATVEEALKTSERRIRNLLWMMEQTGTDQWLWVCDVEQIGEPLLDAEYPNLQMANWFWNINTPDDLINAAAGGSPE